MRISRRLAPALVLSVTVALCLGQAAKGPAQKAAPEVQIKSFIRMDLLRPPTEEAGLPKRNIFSARSSYSGSPPLGSSTMTMPPASYTGKAFDVANAAGEVKEGEVAPPVVTVNLRYIGFIESVKSPRRLTALIILEGQAIAVREGEVVSEGVKIGKISPQEIEVILPDSSTRTFSLEGEGQ